MSAAKQKPRIIVERRFVGNKPMKKVFQQMITAQVQRKLVEQMDKRTD